MESKNKTSTPTLDRFFYEYTENEMNSEKLIAISEKHSIDFSSMNLSLEQINHIEEVIFELEKAFWQLGFKACFELFKELNSK